MNKYSCKHPQTKDIIPDYANLAEVLKVLSVKNRLKILFILNTNPHCVCELTSCLKLSQSLISHHLADLKNLGLVEFENKENRVYYSVTVKGKKVFILLNDLSKETKK